MESVSDPYDHFGRLYLPAFYSLARKLLKAPQAKEHRYHVSRGGNVAVLHSAHSISYAFLAACLALVDQSFCFEETVRSEDPTAWAAPVWKCTDGRICGMAYACNLWQSIHYRISSTYSKPLQHFRCFAHAADGCTRKWPAWILGICLRFRCQGPSREYRIFESSDKRKWGNHRWYGLDGQQSGISLCGRECRMCC